MDRIIDEVATSDAQPGIHPDFIFPFSSFILILHDSKLFTSTLQTWSKISPRRGLPKKAKEVEELAATRAALEKENQGLPAFQARKEGCRGSGC